MSLWATASIFESHVVVTGNTTIGEETHIYPFASIGHIPQDLKFGNEDVSLEIGARNRIREHVTMNPGTEGGGGLTKVGNDGLFMMGSHVAHDCIVGDNVILANNATLGGHVTVGDFAILGGLVVCINSAALAHMPLSGQAVWWLKTLFLLGRQPAIALNFPALIWLASSGAFLIVLKSMRCGRCTSRCLLKATAR